MKRTDSAKSGDEAALLRSRIHSPGCNWTYTCEATEELEAIRREDESAYELLLALARRSTTHGLPSSENNNEPNSHHPSHRCPVGDRVPTLDNHGFNDLRPLPWMGELYAESEDGRTLYRLYFIERRPGWAQPTDLIVGSGTSTKPVASGGAWCPADQTNDMRLAMNAGIAYCENLRAKWRRWNST